MSFFVFFIDFHYLYAKMEIAAGQKKGLCGHFMSVKDAHGSCRKCRECSREQKCTVCISWSAEDWVAFVDGPKARSDKKTRRSENSLTEVSITNQEEISGFQGEPFTQSSPRAGVESLGTPSVGMLSSDNRHLVGSDPPFGANTGQPAVAPVSRPGSISHVDNRFDAQGGHYPSVGMTAESSGETSNRNTSYSDTTCVQPITGDFSPSTGELSLSTGELSQAVFGIQQWIASLKRAGVNPMAQPVVQQSSNRPIETAVSDRRSRARVRAVPAERTARNRRSDSSDSDTSRNTGRRSWRSSATTSTSSRRKRTYAEDVSDVSSIRSTDSVPRNSSGLTEAEFWAETERKYGRDALPASHPRSTSFVLPTFTRRNATQVDLTGSLPPAKLRKTTESGGRSVEGAPQATTSTEHGRNRAENYQAQEDPDALEINAPRSEVDKLDGSQDESDSQSTTSKGTTRDDGEPSESQASTSQAELPPRETGFSECIAQLYKVFDEDICPPPPPQQQVNSLVASLTNKATAASKMRSTPLSTLLLKSMDLVDDEVRGKIPGKPALSTGKWPFVKSSPRTKTYKVHTPRLANLWPALDKDADKIDSNPNSFKSVNIDRTSFHQLAESSRHIARAVSLQDWFSGAACKYAEEKDPVMFKAYLEAAAKCTTFAADMVARQHAALVLMERDAWLERPSVQLSNELKQEARLQPYSPHSLFGGSLAELAIKSAKDRQNEIWLHGTPGKQSKGASTFKGNNQKSTISTPSGKGKQSKKSFKKGPQGKGQSGQAAKRNNQSGFKTPAPRDQRS